MSTPSRLDPRPELILFDAVGTLIFPDPPVLIAYQRVGSAFGEESSAAELAIRWKTAFHNARTDRQTSEAAEVEFWRAIVGQMLPGVPLSNREPAFQELWQHFSQPVNWRLFEDVAETFAELRERGYRLGIASNFDARLLGICRDLPPLQSCTDVFVSSQIGWRKPADEFYTAVQRAAQVPQPQILMIGDSCNCDYEAPRRNGWQARWLMREAAKAGTEQICNLKDLLLILPS